MNEDDDGTTHRTREHTERCVCGTNAPVRSGLGGSIRLVQKRLVQRKTNDRRVVPVDTQEFEREAKPSNAMFWNEEYLPEATVVDGNYLDKRTCTFLYCPGILLWFVGFRSMTLP